MKRESDNDLMLRVAGGELEPLGSLYQRWRGRVAALYYGIVGDRTEAADLTQEVFLRILRYRGSFRGSASFGSWLYTLARRVCLDRVDQRQRSREVGERLQIETTTITTRDEAGIARLRRAFESLDAENRELLVLHRVDGWKYREIAEMWNVAEGTLKVRAHRALAQLRQRYRELEREEHEIRRT